jgi:two-component system chemotaxis response regulator CheY
MNILIADDSKMIRHMVIAALNELGYTDITEASDVGEAKILLKGKKIDCIISDWNMPGETGLDFLKYVRSRPEYATVPFILQTTENDKKKIVEAVKSGVQGYLIKPVQKNALAQKMLELSTVYKFQPPSMAMPPKPVAAGKINAGPSVPGETGVSARSLPEFASALVQRDYGFSCEVKIAGAAPLLACIGNDAYGRFPETFRDRFPGASCVLICDSNAEKEHKVVIDKIEKETGCFKITIPDMNNNRTVMQYGAIIDALAAKEIDASSVIVAFGQTALLSVAGFAAATYRGGIGFAAVPLSLTDALDASVGAPWIINGAQSERVAGLHYDPGMLWWDVSSLVGLPDIEYSYACAEFFRYAFIGGKELFDTITEQWEKLLKKDFAAIAECVRLCVAARASIRALNADTASKDAALCFAQSLANAMMISGKKPLNPGQALFKAITCLCEASKRSGTLAAGSNDAYVKILKKMPSFQMPEPLDHGKVFQKAFGPGARDFGRTFIALPSVAGCVIAKEDIPEAVFQEVLKSFLAPSNGSAEKKINA